MVERDRVPVDVVQVPLSNDHVATPDPDPAGDQRGGGRQLIGAAIVLAVIAAVWFGLDDGSGERAEGPVASDPGADAPPPTLPSPEPVPTTTIAPPVVLAAPAATVPTYPRVVDVGLGTLSQYDIVGAVDRLTTDRDRRSSTRIEVEPDGVVTDITVERDATNDRYRIDLRTGSWAQTTLIDVPGDVVVITRPGRTDLELGLSEFIAGIGHSAQNPREFLDALLLGPVRPDTFRATGTRGRALVTVGDVRVAREYITVVAGATVPAWRPHALGPVTGLAVDDPSPLLEYRVYVDSTGRIAQVNGVGVFGDSAQLIRHRLEPPGTAVTIDMPAPPG